MIARYAKRACLRRPSSPHVLRHSTATELAEVTTIRVVQEHFDHASVRTTEGYVHTKSDAVGAIGELGRRFRRAALAKKRARPEAHGSAVSEAQTCA